MITHVRDLATAPVHSVPVGATPAELEIAGVVSACDLLQPLARSRQSIPIGAVG